MKDKKLAILMHITKNIKQDAVRALGNISYDCNRILVEIRRLMDLLEDIKYEHDSCCTEESDDEATLKILWNRIGFIMSLRKAIFDVFFETEPGLLDTIKEIDNRIIDSLNEIEQDYKRFSDICEECINGETTTEEDSEYVLKDETPEQIVESRISVDVKFSQINLVYVKAGWYSVGKNSSHNEDERPEHNVYVDGYYISNIPVTQTLWRTVMGYNPSNIKGTDKPVVNVSWDECQRFIEELNKLTSKNFRLPTEAEWEIAAKGGHLSEGYKYSGSDAIDEVGWYKSNSYRPKSDRIVAVTDFSVAGKCSNELGLYDMSGNVWEWCQDWYGRYDCTESDNPQGPLNGTEKVAKGGSRLSLAADCRVAKRMAFPPTEKSSVLGLRLVLVP